MSRRFAWRNFTGKQRVGADDELDIRLVLRSMPDALVAVYDRDLRCVMLEGPMLERGGFDPRDYVGRPIEQTLPPDGYERLAPMIRAALSGETCSSEWISSVSGVTYEVEIAPYHAADGSIAGALAVARDVGERNARIRALAESERMLAEAQAIAQLGSWTWDEAADRATWSDEMYRIFARDPAAGPLTGAQFIASVHPQDRERMADDEAAPLGVAPSFDMDYRITTDAGEERVLYVRGRRDGEGRYSGTVQDVTQLRATERALGYSEQFFRAAVEQAPIGIAIVAPDGRWLTVNREVCELTGYSEAELLAMRFQDITHPDDLEDDLAQKHALLSHAVRNYAKEKRYLRKDGSIVWVQLSASLIRDAQGEPVHFINQLQDVTEVREARRARDEALEHFEAAFDRAPIGMGVADLSGRILRVNEALSWITGYAAEELTAMTTTALVHPEDLEQVQRECAPLTQGDDAVTYTHRVEHAAGHIIWVQVTLTTLRDAGGAPLHSLVQMVDVSEQRVYEDELQHMADHDPLTSLLNRRGFEAALGAHLARCQRYGASGALMMLDLDGFKAVNDTLGHAAGDEIIKSTAAALATRLRQTDVVARLGGDEFAVLLPTENRAEAEAVAQALLSTVHERATTGPDGPSGLVTASIGVALLSDELLSAETLVANADLAMYSAKAAGKSRYVVFSAALQASSAGA